MTGKRPLAERAREWLRNESAEARQVSAYAKLAAALGIECSAGACSGVVDGVVLVADGFALRWSSSPTWGTRVTAGIWPDTRLEAAPPAAEVPCDWEPSSEALWISHDREQAVLADRASACFQMCGYLQALDWLDRRLGHAVMACPHDWSFVITHREVIARRVGVETDEGDFLAVARLAVELARAVRACFTAVGDAARELHQGHNPVQVVSGGASQPRAAAGFVLDGIALQLCLTQGPWGPGARWGDQWIHTEVLVPLSRTTDERFAIVAAKVESRMPPREHIGDSAAPEGLLGALRDLPRCAFGDFVLRSNDPSATLGRLSRGVGEQLRLADPNVVHADDGRSIRVLLDGIVLETERLRRAAGLAIALSRAGDGPYRTG